MKTLLYTLIFFVSPFLTAQGVFNNGCYMVVGDGAHLTILGDSGHIVNAASITDGTIDNDGTISLQGRLTNTATNNMFINVDNNGEVIFNGTSGQFIGGTNGIVFEKLTISNGSGVTLQQGVTVGDSLVLNAGALRLDAHTITITNTAGSAISRNTGYIVSEQTDNSGIVAWNIGTNSSVHVFPFGTTGGTYIPFSLDLSSGDIGYVRVATYHTAPDNTPYPVTPYAVTSMNDVFGNDNTANTADRFWQIDKTGPGGIATLVFTVTAPEAGTITDLTAQRWNDPAQTWEVPLPGQTYTAVSVTVPGVADFSAWTLSGNGSPLPIDLLLFTATLTDERTVDLLWVTASETSNDYFTIERTRDGINYETVGVTDGAGNSTQLLQYTGSDQHPYSGISYYRLKQTDFNGAFSYSSPVAVHAGDDEKAELVVFPNPSTEQVTVSAPATEGQEVHVIMTDASGKTAFAKTAVATGTTYVCTVPREFFPAAGVYFITLWIGDKTYASYVIAE
jgi:hypothetical protein